MYGIGLLIIHGASFTVSSSTTDLPPRKPASVATYKESYSGRESGRTNAMYPNTAECRVQNFLCDCVVKWNLYKEMDYELEMGASTTLHGLSGVLL
jgi:hypothetical protein